MRTEGQKAYRRRFRQKKAAERSRCEKKTARGNAAETEQEALAEARRMSKKVMRCITPFLCPHCGKWHVGNAFD